VESGYLITNRDIVHEWGSSSSWLGFFIFNFHLVSNQTVISSLGLTMSIVGRDLCKIEQSDLWMNEAIATLHAHTRNNGRIFVRDSISVRNKMRSCIINWIFMTIFPAILSGKRRIRRSIASSAHCNNSKKNHMIYNIIYNVHRSWAVLHNCDLIEDGPTTRANQFKLIDASGMALSC